MGQSFSTLDNLFCPQADSKLGGLMYCPGPTKLTNMNICFIEPLYTIPSHTQHPSNKPVPLSLSLSLASALIQVLLKHILTLFSQLIFLLDHRSSLFCKSSLLSSWQRHPSRPTCKVQDSTQPRSSWRVTVLNFGKNKNVGFYTITKR